MATCLSGRGVLHPAAVVLGLVLLAGGASAADLRVCVDSASPTAARDRDVAAKVASQAGMTLALVGFDGSGDDEGLPVKRFHELLTSKCSLVMGFPVDTTAPSLPDGLLATKPYVSTGFVLVTAPGETAHDLADLPAGTEVAVTYGTAPNLYFPDHANILPDVHPSDAETMQAIATGKVRAAMLWQATVEGYMASPGAKTLAVYPLTEPHARYDVVALYLAEGAPEAHAFNATKISLDTAMPAADGPPALYTETQAKLGYVKFLGNCAQCHGAHLEGRSGPSLKGPNWANAAANYTVGEVFTVVSQQMPATNPGSLDKVDYEQIMAFLLQQNGYPAGPAALAFNSAAASKVPLLFHAVSNK